MNGRIRSLEQHMEERDNYIQEIEQRLQSREAQVAGLESEMDQLSSELRKKDLILSGLAVPAPPTRAWTEDVTATALATLGQFLPSVSVSREDIAECYRLSRGKRILCRFRECGNGSVRDKVYEARFGAVAPAAAAGSGASAGGASPPRETTESGEDATARSGDAAGVAAADSGRASGREGNQRATDERPTPRRLYVSENLTRKRQDIFQELLNLKRAKQLHGYTKTVIRFLLRMEMFSVKLCSMVGKFGSTVWMVSRMHFAGRYRNVCRAAWLRPPMRSSSVARCQGRGGARSRGYVYHMMRVVSNAYQKRPAEDMLCYVLVCLFVCSRRWW